MVGTAAPQELLERVVGRVAGHDVLADGVERLADVDGRGQRVRSVDVRAVPGGTAQATVLATHELTRRPSRRRPSPC